MMFVEQIREGQTVYGSDGEPIGTVEALSGQLLRLNGPDSSEEGAHHFIDLAFVASVEGERITLLVPSSEAKERWSAESD